MMTEGTPANNSMQGFMTSLSFGGANSTTKMVESIAKEADINIATIVAFNVPIKRGITEKRGGLAVGSHLKRLRFPSLYSS